MKKTVILLILCNISLIQYGQIIADHTVVDKFDDIPQYYIDQVKKMWVVYAGESHSEALRRGVELLEASYPEFAVEVAEYTSPLAYTTSYLRLDCNTWGDLNNATGWIRSYGEEDWYTSSAAIARTKAGITYCNESTSLGLSVIAFGHCYTDGGGNYISATQQYVDYVAAHAYPTKVIYTTGPNDSPYYPDEDYARYQAIRAYVDADPTLILFDFADILCYKNDGSGPNTILFNGVYYPYITNESYIPNTGGFHFSNAGALRLAKAMWWMLARIAGWDGGTTITSGTWLGGTADWNTGSNWYGGIVPTSVTNVIIPLTTKQPVISSPLTAICNNMSINSGASLTINAGGALTVNGSLSNSGTLKILSAATDNNGSLIVKGSSSGSVTYNRFLRPENNAGDLHYLSSPVGGQSISGFTAANSSKINILDSKYQIWQWNEESSSDNWQIVSSSGNFVTGKGYNIDQKTGSDGLLIFTGSVINSATFTATSPYINGYTARTTLYDYGYNNPNPIWSGTRNWTNYGGGGWNLMGNPFTSAMNAATFIAANAGSFDPYYQALYVYDGLSGVYKYAAAETPGYQGGESYGNYVQTGQGFFVLALYDGIVFNFNSTMQVHNSSVAVLKSATAEDPWPGLQLKVKYSSNSSLTTIVFNSEMTAGLDPGYDVGQFSAGPDVEIYTTLAAKDNSVNFARQALPVSGADTIIVPIGVDSEKGGDVTFSAYTVQLENYKFWLEDRIKGIFTDLNTNTYSVTLPNNTYGTGRFFIYASVNTPTAIQSQPEDPGIRVWTSDNKMIVKGSVSDRAICEVYDLQGKKVFLTHLADGELNVVNINLSSRGVYLVRIIDGLKVFTKKVILL